MNSLETLLAENEALKIRIQELSIQDVSVDLLRTQRNQLLSALGRPELDIDSIATSTSSTTNDIKSFITSLSKDSLYTLAAILLRPPLAPFDEFIIDAGADRGIVSGSKVYAPGNILIGTTSDVLDHTSKVILFSSPGEKYPIFIGPDNVPATAVGRGGGQYEAQVPQATTIKEGDIVTDASLGDGIFGKVTKIINNPADPYTTILFSPPINIYQLRWVFVSNKNK